jgi:hypothetical protein
MLAAAAGLDENKSPALKPPSQPSPVLPPHRPANAPCALCLPNQPPRAANIVVTPQRNVVALEGTPEVVGQVSAMHSELEHLRQALAARSAECDALRARLSGDGRGRSSSGGSGEASTPQTALDRLLRRASQAREARLRRTSAAGAARISDSGGWTSHRLSSGGGSEANGAPSSGGGASRAAGSPLSEESCGAKAKPAVGSLIWRVLQFHRHTERAAAATIAARPKYARPASVPPQAEAAAAAAVGALAPSAAAREASARLRRHCSLTSAAELPDITSYPERRTALGSIGGASIVGTAVRRASEGGSSGGDGTCNDTSLCPSTVGGTTPLAVDAQLAQAPREAALHEHIQRSLIQLLQTKKGEVRQLQRKVDELQAALVAAAAEQEAKETRLQQMREGVAKLGAARQSEVAKWASHLQGLEASLRQAQQEVQEYADEAASTRERLVKQAGQLQTLGGVVAGLCSALTDGMVCGCAKGSDGGARVLCTCMRLAAR